MPSSHISLQEGLLCYKKNPKEHMIHSFAVGPKHRLQTKWQGEQINKLTSGKYPKKFI